MDIISKIIQNFFILEKEPQKIGLSQFKEQKKTQETAPSIRSKDVKLSDLMRRAS